MACSPHRMIGIVGHRTENGSLPMKAVVVYRDNRSHAVISLNCLQMASPRAQTAAAKTALNV